MRFEGYSGRSEGYNRRSEGYNRGSEGYNRRYNGYTTKGPRSITGLADVMRSTEGMWGIIEKI